MKLAFSISMLYCTPYHFAIFFIDFSFFLLIHVFVWKRAVRINDFWKWTFLMKQFWLGLLSIWALALKKTGWMLWTLCGKAESNPESKTLGSKQGWLTTLALPFSRKQNLEKTDSLAQPHVREVEQWDQLPDEPFWLFSQWSAKHVKIIHPHMLGLKIVCTVDPFVRNVQAVFSVHLGLSSNDWKLFVAEPPMKYKDIEVNLYYSPFAAWKYLFSSKIFYPWTASCGNHPITQIRSSNCSLYHCHCLSRAESD